MKTALVIGAGPAGLMAAETLAQRGLSVTVVEQCSTPGRKFLMAGRGGLNLTHSEDLPEFLARYGDAEEWLRPALAAFPPHALRDWSGSLGHDTVVGSSGRVFPKSFRATELLRAWLVHLGSLGVTLRTRVCFLGFSNFAETSNMVTVRLKETGSGAEEVAADVVVLALGGASWPRTGSDGKWTSAMDEIGVAHRPLLATNCGYRVSWTPHFQSRFAGVPLKNVCLSVSETQARGDAMITDYGVEGGPVYALSDALYRSSSSPALLIDLAPDLTRATIEARLKKAPAKLSLVKMLERAARLSPVAISLLREVTENNVPREPSELAQLIKRLSLPLLGPQSLERAISSRGGIQGSEVDRSWMLNKLPGVFVAGEMLDWTAPTGGYLLQACFATGKAAANGALLWLECKA